MKTDANVIIGTSIDNSGLEEGLDEARKELEEFNKDAEDIMETGAEIKPKVDESSSSEAKSALENFAKKFAEGASEAISERLGVGDISTELSGLSTEISSLLPAIAGVALAVGAIVVAFKTAKTAVNVFKKVLGTIGNVIKKIISVIGDVIKGLVSGFGKISKSIIGLAKSSLNWGASIFGVRSASDLVSKSLDKIKENNQEIENSINLITGAIATVLEPIVMRIVSLVYTLLSYINQLVTGLTGKDLFASAKKNMASTAKSAKEVNKQLASFDEMNVLNDSSSGAGAGSNANALPEIDKNLINLLKGGSLSAIAETISGKIVGALNAFADTIASINWAAIGQGISDFLTNIDFSGILVGLTRVFGESILAFQDMFLNINWPKILGNIGTAIANSFSTIDKYINSIKWGQIGQQLSKTLTSIPWSEIMLNLRQAVWDSIKGIGELFKNIDWGEVGKTVSDFLNDMWVQTQLFFEEIDWAVLGADVVDAIWNFITNVDWLQLGTNIIIGLLEGINASVQFVLGIFSEILTKILSLFGIDGTSSTVFSDIGNKIINAFIDGIKYNVDLAVGIFTNIWNKIQEIFGGVKDWFKDRFGEAWDNVKNVFSKVGEFFGGIWDKIKSKFSEIGTKVGDAIGSAFKKVINGVLQTIENILNTPIKGINALLDIINAVPGINLGKLPTLKLPRLAKGGIVNLPGKGVPVGASAYAGETGREGVIPLTDSQQMALLGEAIGRYITVNATINNSMNGRLISREIQKINNESDFAFNR